MSYSIKISCTEELLALGIKSALKEEKTEIVKDIKNLSDSEILITDRFFFHYSLNKRIIMLYSDRTKAALGSEKIRIMKSATATELQKAVKAAKEKEYRPYTSKEIKEQEKQVKKYIKSLKELNRRESEILTGILEDQTNAEIAKRLYLSEKTVKNNITKLYRKIGTKNRSEVKDIAEKLDINKNKKD